MSESDWAITYMYVLINYSIFIDKYSILYNSKENLLWDD